VPTWWRRQRPEPAEPGGQRPNQAVPGSAPGTTAAGPTVESNLGQIIQNTGPGPVHAPVNPGTYVAQQVLRTGPSVDWPVWVGVVPQLADKYQPRDGVQQQLEAHLGAGATAVLTQADAGAAAATAATSQTAATPDTGTRVLSGLGGNGKTQLAAAYARRLRDAGELDLLGWVTAASRDSILSGYAATARQIGLAVDGLEAGQAAEALLVWCETTAKRWLLVLDDLTDPAHLTGLWPTGPTGKVLVTTRRHDTTLTTHGRKLIDVGLFTPDEAAAYLTAKLHPDELDQASELATDLGLLPLALAQAAAVMAERGWSCAEYRSRFADQRRHLAQLMPPDAVADDYATGPHALARAIIATTWALSISAADQLLPAGLASQLLTVAAFLDPNGIPTTVFTAGADVPPAPPIAVDSSGSADGLTRESLDDDGVRAGLGNLARLSLAELDGPPARATTVRVHALVQRAVRDGLDRDATARTARAAAALLLTAWPFEDYRPENALLAASLRANTATLTGLAPDVLWQPAPHSLLWRAGRSLKGAGQPHAALDYHAELLEQAEQRLGPEHPDTLTARNNLAAVYQDAGRLADALPLLEATAVIFERILGPAHTAILTSRNNLARVYQAAGRLTDALPLYEATLTDRERVLGPDHPDTLTSRNDLAFAYQAAGRLTDALPLFEATLTARQRIQGPDHSETLSSRNNLALAYQTAGRLTDALPLYEATLTARQRILGPDHPDTLTSRGNLGYAYRDAGRHTDALPLLEATLTTRERILGPDHPDTLISRGNLALAYQDAGRHTDALPLYEATLTDRERVLGPDHPHTLISRAALAQARDAVAADPPS
jgi:tetratricopeptide (TPR) repeat protein